MSSSPPSPTLEELLVGLPDDRLDARVSDPDLQTIARSLKRWKGVSPYLGLTEAEEEEIIEDKKDYLSQKSAALRKWRKKKGDAATYRNLAEAFHESELIDSIGKICQVLRGPMKGSDPSNSNAPHIQGTTWIRILILSLGAVLVMVAVIVAVILVLSYIIDCKPMSLTLPTSVEHFVGRDREIDDIVDKLHNFRTVSIVGSPGFGKSALAIMVGHRLMDEGNTVIYIDVNEVMDFGDIKQRVLDGIDITDATSDRMMEQRFRKWASKLNCPVTIILDGCDGMLHYDKETLYKSIEYLEAYSYHIRILTTSRSHLTLATANSTELDQLSTKNAKLLLSKLHPPLNESQIIKFQQATGGMPLALKVIAALLKRDDTPEKLITELQQKGLVTPLSHYDLSSQLRLNDCIEFSYSKLNSQLQLFFQYIAGFPLSFTSDNACCIATGDCELELVAFVSENSSMQRSQLLSNLSFTGCREMLDHLVTRSLLLFDRKTDVYYFHRFIRDFLLGRRKDEVAHEFEFMFTSYYLQIKFTPTCRYFKHSLFVIDIMMRQGWFHAFNWVLEGSRNYFHFLTQTLCQLPPGSMQPLDGTTSHLLQRNYTRCIHLHKNVLEQNSASSSPVEKTIMFFVYSTGCFFNLDNDVILEAVVQEAGEVFPILMKIPSSDLLEAQVFNKQLELLHDVFYVIGKIEWACSLTEKNVAVWRSSNLTMSIDLENAAFNYVIKCCNQRNITAMKRMHEALFEHRRRVQKRIENVVEERKGRHPYLGVDVPQYNEWWKGQMILMELDMMFCSAHPSKLRCGKSDTEGFIVMLMMNTVVEWEQLPHQLLENLVGQMYYKAIKHFMKQYRKVGIKLRYCAMPDQGDLGSSTYEIPRERWTNLNQWMVLANDLGDQGSEWCEMPRERWTNLKQWLVMAYGLIDISRERKTHQTSELAIPIFLDLLKISCILQVQTYTIITELIVDMLQLLQQDGIPYWVYWNELYYDFLKSRNTVRHSIIFTCAKNYKAYTSELKKRHSKLLLIYEKVGLL